MQDIVVIVDNNLIAFMLDTLFSIMIAYGTLSFYIGKLRNSRTNKVVGAGVIILATIFSALLWLAQT